LELGSDNRLDSESVAGVDHSCLELRPCWDTVVAASGVDVVVAGIVDLVAEAYIVVEVEMVAALAFGVDIESALRPTAQPEQSLPQFQQVCLHSQRHKPHCFHLVVAYMLEELHCWHWQCRPSSWRIL